MRISSGLIPLSCNPSVSGLKTTFEKTWWIQLTRLHMVIFGEGPVLMTNLVTLRECMWRSVYFIEQNSARAITLEEAMVTENTRICPECLYSYRYGAQELSRSYG